MTMIETSMTANQRLAALSDLLPDTGSPARGWRARFAWITRPFRRHQQGLAAIPERYRLQFLVLASDAMPGAEPGEVAAMAGRLADATRIPGRLLAKLPETTDLDKWFRDNCDQITASLAGLLEAEA